MKSFLFAAALIFMLTISFKTNAQLPHASLYVHALYAAALDKSSQNLYNGGLGVVGGILVGKKATRFNASIGYSHFFADNSKNILGDENYIPVKLGVRQYLPLTLNFLFLQGDLGAGFVNNKNSTNNDARFAFDVGAGVKFAGFEAALVWDNFSEKHPKGISSWATIQAGFNLGF